MNAIAPPSVPAAGPQLDRRRVLAGLVDLAIVVAGVFVLSYIFGMVSGGDGATLGRQTILIGMAWVLFYSFAFESDGGQTPGKKLLKLRVVSADGSPSTTREIAVRTVLRVIDGAFVYLVGLIVMLVTGEKRQRLGDLAAGTKVVDAGADAGPTASAAPAAAVPQAPEAPEGVRAPEVEADAPEPGPAHSLVDIGTPLPGMSAPEQSSAPEVKEFTPFAEPAEPLAEEPEPEEPVVEEPVAEEPAFEPQVAVEPQEPVVEEPVAEEPAFEPQVAVEPQEPLVDEPAFESQEPVVEEPAYEPQVEAVPQPEQPVADEPAFETPAFQPAPHVEAAAEPAYEAPAEPVHDASAEPDAADETEADEMTFRPMASPVSAMDLLMAEDEDEDESPPAGEPPQGA